jgi:DNA-binding NtrC family response regulator
MQTLMLVEDDAAVRKVLRHILLKLGYTVLEASGAAEALALSERFAEPIELLITDVVLPQTSSDRLVQHLRSQRPGLKVMYISGYSEDMLAHYGIAHTAPNFLQKPFTPEKLARKVREVLAAHSRTRRAAAGDQS